MQILPSGLPEEVGNHEDLARFLTQSGHFSKATAKASAFLPSPHSRETSVARHGESPAEALWKLGLAAAGGRPLYGAAIIQTTHVRETGLDARADEPPDRHAVITGWPWIDADPEMQKAKQREKALMLASQSKLILRDTPGT